MATTEESKRGKAIGSNMSKKKFNEITQVVKVISADDSLNADSRSSKIMDEIASIFNFDPDAKNFYDKAEAKKRYEGIKKKATELGVTVYELNGHKKFYEKHKDQQNKKRTENKRKAALRKRESVEETTLN